MNTTSEPGRKITQSLGFKVLLSASLIIIALTTLLTVADVLDEYQRAGQDERKSLTKLYENYQDDVRDLESEAGAIAISIADRADLKQLLISGDKEGMYALLSPVFSELKANANIVHLYVEKPDGTVFVRIHNPSQFGDSILYRQTAASVLNTKQTVAGVEIGPNRLGVRGVAPLFNGDEFIGMVEVGLDFDKSFVERLRDHTGADYNIWVTHSAAAVAGLKPQQDAFISPSSELFYYTGTLPHPLPIPEETYVKVLGTNAPEIQYVEVDGQEFVALVAPLLAYGGRTIGIFEISSSRAEALAEIRSDTNNGFLIAFLVGIVSLAGIWWASQTQVLRPITELSTAARKQIEGDLTTRVTFNRRDEFGDLARVFNGLSEKLAEMIRQLESHVVERTRELERANEANARRARQFQAISQVAGSIASIRTLDELLPRITQLISEEFDFYHVGIFLNDDSNQYAILSAANSIGGQRMLARGHQLRIGEQGIVGYVTGTGHPRIALNTGADSVFFNNPDLPETRSEMALPLIISGKVIGALDVQSDKPDAFAQDAIEVLSTLANQVSIAIQNARSFIETQKLLVEAQSVMAGYITESWKVMRPPSLSRGYRKVGSDIKPLEQSLGGEQINQAIEQGMTVLDSTRLAVPVRLRGEVIGVMNLQIPEGQQWTTDEVRIAEAVAERLSLAIETATLVKATQRRANIERITTDITGRIGSSTHLETILQTAAQELSRAMGGADVLVQIEPVALKLSSAG